MTQSQVHSADTTPVNQSNKFSGWKIILAGTFILFISSGIGFYGQGVILDPLRIKFGWSKGSISYAITLYFLTAGFAGLFIGRQTDKYGPKSVLVIGTIIFGIGLASIGFVTKLWQLYIAYFIMALGFSGMSLMVISTLIANWYIIRRGRAMSFTMTGLSVGGVILVPLSTYMIAEWGLKTALNTLAALACIIIVPVAIFVIKQRPSDLGQVPDGGVSQSENGENTEEELADIEAQMRVWTRREAFKTKAFWAIVIAFWLALTGQIAFLMHQISFLSQYVEVQGAAKMVSITSGASIAGRLFLGSIADKYDKRYLTAGCFLIQAAAVLLLSLYNHVAILYLGTFLFGLAMGSIIMMQSLLIGECFGLVSFGTIYGTAMLFSSFGSAFGPTMAGLIFDTTQSYQIAFGIFAIASVLASIIILSAKPPQPPESRIPV